MHRMRTLAALLLLLMALLLMALLQALAAPTPVRELERLLVR